MGIVGKTIVEVRPLTLAEADAESWPTSYQVAVVLDDGVLLYASRDDEGNGPGALFGAAGSGASSRFLVSPERPIGDYKPSVTHIPFKEALMRAWVRGWQAGRDGQTTDDGKIEAADAIISEFPELEDSAGTDAAVNTICEGLAVAATVIEMTLKHAKDAAARHVPTTSKAPESAGQR